MYAKTDKNNVVLDFVNDDEHSSDDVLISDGVYELLAKDGCFKYKIVDGELVERTEAERDKDWKHFKKPTQEEILAARYAARVEALVRERYKKVSDELALLRQRDTKQDEFAAYDEFVEQCKEQARKEVYGDDLPIDQPE